MIFRWFFSFWFWVFGWKAEGAIPKSCKKYIILVAPHTSYTDFFVGVAARNILRLNIKFLAKEELFKKFYGPLLRLMGGYPVKRTAQTNMVDAVANIFKEKEKFALCITPEGTRKRVDQWRTGFYYISQKAEVPIVLAGFCFQRKLVKLTEPFHPGDDVETEIEKMKEYFRDFKGKYPENGVI